MNSSRTWPAGRANLSDRDYFIYAPRSRRAEIVHQRDRARTASAATATSSLPSGSMAAMAIFSDWCSPGRGRPISSTSTTPSPPLEESSFVLLRDDGTALVRHPDVGKSDRPEAAGEIGLVSAGARQAAGISIHSGAFDGVARLIAVQPLKDFPLVVNVGIPSKRALCPAGNTAPWPIGLGTALALICSLLLIYALYHQFAQFAASRASLIEREARLAEKTAELEQANARIDTAIDHMVQGLVMFNATGRTGGLQRPLHRNLRASARAGQTGHLDPARARIAHRGRHLLRRYRRLYRRTAHQDERRRADDQDHANSPTAGPFASPTGRPATARWVATHEDITERRRDEKELQRARNMLRAVVENIPETLIVKDAQSRQYVFLNRAGEALFGVSRTEFIGKTCDEIFPVGEAARVHARDEEAIRTGQLTIESRAADTLDGRVREVTSRRIAIGGKDGASRIHHERDRGRDRSQTRRTGIASRAQHAAGRGRKHPGNAGREGGRQRPLRLRQPRRRGIARRSTGTK